jgi:M6 family metalloprotease-like protein
LLLTILGACAVPAEPAEDTDSTAAALGFARAGDYAFDPGTAVALNVTEPSVVGDVTVVIPPEAAPVVGPKKDWRVVPGLSGAIQSAAGANLTITVTAEVFGTAGVWLRARVDGALLAATPMLATTNQPHDDTRSFTFVAPNVAAGQHTVEIEWSSAAPGTAPQMRDRSLTMHSASPTTGTGRLAVNQSTSLFQAPTGGYGAVPGTATSITTAQAGPLAITFSSDAMIYSGRLFAQAVVDGAVVADALVAETTSLSRRGSRSFTVFSPSVAAGTHTVEIRAGGGSANIYARTINVASAPTTSAAGGMVGWSTQQAPTTITSTGYITLMSTSFTTSAAASTAVIDAGGEVQSVGGRLFWRALVDGVPVKPSNVNLLQNENVWRTQSFAFGIDNLTPGYHSVSIQAAVDGSTTAYLGDRFVRVHHARRSGAAFVQGYGGMRPKTKPFRTLVICFDPHRSGVPAPTRAQVQGHFEGTDGDLSVRAWWAENSNNRITASTVQYLGCDDSGWFSPPPGREGNWYWDNGAYELMWQDALRAADPYFDFHAYDTDGDNNISADELMVAIVRPQNGPYGTTRGTSVALDGNATPLGVHVSDLYLSSYPWARREGVGLIAHEFSHSLAGAMDIYAPCPSDTDAGSFSVMTWHGNATHMDPWHKMKSGFVTPDAIAIPSWTTSTLALPAVESGNHEVTVLYDPARADREYFVIENRFGGGSTYDSSLGNSVVVWHVIEDAATRNTYPTPATNTGCRIPIRFIRSMNTNNTSHDLLWADGTSAKVRLTLRSAPGATTSVEFAKLP